MDWTAIATLIGAGVSLVAANLGVLQWMLTRKSTADREAIAQRERIAKELTELRISLPLEYVRREDWIRFSSTIDAKLDAMRAEFREELGNLKARLT